MNSLGENFTGNVFQNGTKIGKFWIFLLISEIASGIIIRCSKFVSTTDFNREFFYLSNGNIE